MFNFDNIERAIKAQNHPEGETQLIIKTLNTIDEETLIANLVDTKNSYLPVIWRISFSESCPIEIKAAQAKVLESALKSKDLSEAVGALVKGRIVHKGGYVNFQISTA